LSWISNLKRGLKSLGEPLHPRAERIAAPRLTASYSDDSLSEPADVKDISSSGLYLVTGKRLPTGEMITITLQEEEAPESSSELQFSVHARVARQGEDGMGLSFVLPPGLDTRLWSVLVRNIVVLNDRSEIENMFYTLRTILFTCRICGAQAEEAVLLLGGQLDSNRTGTLVKLALGGERLLAEEPDGERMRADPKLVTNILREGSWAPDEMTLKLWMGLLVSSCSVDSPDDSNQVFVDLLIHTTPNQAKILVHACERALQSAPGDENLPPGSVVLTAQEMADLTGVHDVARNATDVVYLFNLGFIQKVVDFTSYLPLDSFDITPSRLGLELYKHCHGSREKVDQQLVDDAENNLLHFIPPPHPPVFGGESNSLLPPVEG
jgi:hypothetical protein